MTLFSLSSVRLIFHPGALDTRNAETGRSTECLEIYRQKHPTANCPAATWGLD